MTKSESLFEQALKVIPGGVNSPVRAYNGVGGTPIFIDRAEGACLIDVDGNSYMRFVLPHIRVSVLVLRPNSK